MSFTEFTTIKSVRIEMQDRAGLQVLVDLEMHKDTEESGVQQLPLFGELAFGYTGDPVGRVVEALLSTCGVSKLSALTGRPLVIYYDKDPREGGNWGKTIPRAVSFASVDGKHEHNVKALVSGS